VVFTPTAQEFAQEVVPTKNHVLLTTLEHVQGRAYILTHGNGKWTRAKLPVPDNQTIGIATSSLLHDKFFLAQSGFLTPSSVLLGDASNGSLKPGKTQKALFDASRDVVQQLEATSKDGTKVPYFVCIVKTFPWTEARRHC
jgi:prolyl oligopeptidase